MPAKSKRFQSRLRAKHKALLDLQDEVQEKCVRLQRHAVLQSEASAHSNRVLSELDKFYNRVVVDGQLRFKAKMKMPFDNFGGNDIHKTTESWSLLMTFFQGLNTLFERFNITFVHAIDFFPLLWSGEGDVRDFGDRRDDELGNGFGYNPPFSFYAFVLARLKACLPRFFGLKIAGLNQRVHLLTLFQVLQNIRDNTKNRLGGI